MYHRRRVASSPDRVMVDRRPRCSSLSVNGGYAFRLRSLSYGGRGSAPIHPNAQILNWQWHNPHRNVISCVPIWNWLSAHLGGHGYEVFVTLRCESSCRYLIDCTAAVRPERHGNVANRNTLGRRRHLASQHRGRSAEARSQATEAGATRGCPQHRVAADIANHANTVGVADVAAACEAYETCECHGQLRRWLPNKLQVRRRPLARMFCFQWHVVVNVQKRRQLQNLRGVQGGRSDNRLESP